MGVTFALLSMLCFASNILISRYAMARMPVDSGFFIILGTNIVAGLAFFVAELALRSTPFVFRWKEAGLFVLGGVIGAFLGRRLLFDTVRLLGPARASVFHSCAPVPTLVFAWIVVGEMLGWYELALMAVVMAGLWITHPPQRDETISRADRATLRRGMMFGLLTITGFGVSNALRGLAMRSWNEAICGALLGGAAAFLMQVLITRDWPRIIEGFRKGGRAGLLLYFASGLATMGGAILIITAMNYMEIALATLITHTTPLVVFPVSLILYRNREGLTPRTVAGVLLVLLGIALLALR